MNHPLQHLVDRTRNDPFFVGCHLDRFAADNEMSEADLAQHLGCDIDRLPLLMLCRMPEMASDFFLSDVLTIAEYVPCDELALSTILCGGN